MTIEESLFLSVLFSLLTLKTGCFFFFFFEVVREKTGFGYDDGDAERGYEISRHFARGADDHVVDVATRHDAQRAFLSAEHGISFSSFRSGGVVVVNADQ